MAAGAGYRTVRARGLSAAEVETQLVNLLSADRPLDVRRLGPGRLGVYRSYRPTWALVLTIVLLPFAGVGLLFLLVKQTDTGEILIVDGPTGTHVTLPPVVPRDLDSSIEARLGGGAPPQHAGAKAGAISDVGVPPVAGGVAGSGPGSTFQQATPAAARRMIQVPDAPAAPAPSVLAAAPPAATTIHAISDDGMDSKTVQRSADRSPKRGSAACVTLRFETSSVAISVGDIVVLGRAPSPRPGARAVVVPGDASTVSKAHATVRVTSAGAEVEDLGSTNGTVIERDGAVLPLKPGESAALWDRDIAVFGAVRAEVHIDTRDGG